MKPWGVKKARTVQDAKMDAKNIKSLNIVYIRREGLAKIALFILENKILQLITKLEHVIL